MPFQIVSKAKSWLFSKNCRACKAVRGEVSSIKSCQILPPTPWRGARHLAAACGVQLLGLGVIGRQ